jgi:hypothetical protein
MLLRPKRNDKPILLNLPKQILEEVDLAGNAITIPTPSHRTQPAPLSKGRTGHLRSHLSGGYELGRGGDAVSLE